MKSETPHPKKLKVRFSRCCSAKTNVFPSPYFVFCTACNKECEYELLPVYKEVSRGTWRKIDYSVQVFS